MSLALMTRASLACALGAVPAFLGAALGWDFGSEPGHGDPSGHATQFVFVVIVPACIYLTLFGIAAGRVRPHPELPRVSAVLFLPVPAFALCLFLWSVLLLVAVLEGQPIDSQRDAVEDVLSTIALIGVLTGWFWTGLLLVFTRRSVMLFIVTFGGALWFGMLLLGLLDALLPR